MKKNWVKKYHTLELPNGEIKQLPYWDNGEEQNVTCIDLSDILNIHETTLFRNFRKIGIKCKRIIDISYISNHNNRTLYCSLENSIDFSKRIKAALSHKNKTTEGYLYSIFLKEYDKRGRLVTGIKVGRTQNLERRLSEYNFCRLCPLEYHSVIAVDNCIKAETALLKKLKLYKHPLGLEEVFVLEARQKIDEFFSHYPLVDVSIINNMF